MGPGAYDPDKADRMTKPKIKNIDLGKSASRPKSFAKPEDVSVAPGQYNHERPFGADVKSHKIREKRPEKQREGMGPGAYNPEKADGQIKAKMPNINMGSSPSRPKSFAKAADVDVAPGQYNHEKPFGADVKAHRIGEKRPEKPREGMGPGAYDPEIADR